jgi:Ca2+/Na+ antiporter
MNSVSRFIFKLSFLLVPFGILTLVLHDGGTGGGIGGGGYDLSGLVYGSILFACIMIWMLWMLISCLISKTTVDRKLYSLLLAVGLLALVVAWFITPSMF